MYESLFTNSLIWDDGCKNQDISLVFRISFSKSAFEFEVEIYISFPAWEFSILFWLSFKYPIMCQCCENDAIAMQRDRRYNDRRVNQHEGTNATYSINKQRGSVPQFQHFLMCVKQHLTEPGYVITISNVTARFVQYKIDRSRTHARLTIYLYGCIPYFLKTDCVVR